MIEPRFHDHEKLEAVVRAKRGASAQASTRGLAPKLKEHFEKNMRGGWLGASSAVALAAHKDFCVYLITESAGARSSLAVARQGRSGEGDLESKAASTSVETE